MRILAGPRNPIRQVSLSDCGRWVGTFRGQFDAVLWDRTTGKPVPRTEEEEDFVPFGATVHPDGRRFLVWGGDGLVVAGTAARTWRLVEPAVYTSWVATAGPRLVGLTSVGRTDQFVGWEWEGDRPRATWRVARNGFLNAPYAVAPGGEWFAAQKVTDDGYGRVEVRSATDGRLLTGLDPPARGLLRAVTDAGAVLFDANGRLVMAAAEVKLPGKGAAAAGLSPDGGRLLAARDKSVYLLDPQMLAVRQTYTFPTAGKPTCVAFAPDGLTAAAGTSKGEVVVWDVD